MRFGFAECLGAHASLRFRPVESGRHAQCWCFVRIVVAGPRDWAHWDCGGLEARWMFERDSTP